MEPTNPSSRRRLGVFGGTFDPPHNGHVTVASELVERGDLDQVMWIPARRPPHKVDRPMARPELRLEMVRAATEGRLGQCPNDIELSREGVSYTVETLRALREQHPETDLVLLLGTDQLALFATWKNPLGIATLADLLVLAREGQDPGAVDPGIDVTWSAARVSRIDVSSSDVRDRIREGRPFRHLIPEGVVEVIEREGLYRN